jgi:epoxyqueuosine reductase
MDNDVVAETTALSASQQRQIALELAAENGFPLHGIAHLSEDGASPRAAGFTSWLEKGFQGPLDYMLASRAARENLKVRFPWARSVLALGAFYDSRPLGKSGQDLAAHVARYARGRDYHSIFERRLKKLGSELIARGVCTKAHRYVDTGPVLERAWAEAAGLGWIGKNTCLIHPKLGSFFLLAEIIMDTQPEADAPQSDHCGTCRRCLDACPTQAFPAPGVLDANRCIVTWNLELRGNTPPETWPQQGEWAAGCDICQTVCPYNAPARVPAADAELSAPLPWQNMTLAECILLTPERFNTAFPRSALRRTTLKGLRLGAITVAGNVNAVTCRDALQACLKDDDADIRARAEWALNVIRER